MNDAAAIRIDVWSDYVCPFCYLELGEIETLQRRLGSAVHVVWRAFELRPAPRPLLEPDGDYLRTAWERSVEPLARQRGVTLRQPPLQTRSRRAHEAAAYARSNGAFPEMHDLLFRACFVEGRDIDQLQVLCELASTAGLDCDGLVHALEERHHAYEVDEDQQLAAELGLTGVPLMVLRRPGQDWDHARAVQGAVSLSTLEQALTEVDNTLFAGMR